VGLNDDGSEQAGMGIVSATMIWTGLWISSRRTLPTIRIFFTETPAKEILTMCTVASGLGVETRYVSWGAGMFDFDNNGEPDLFFVTGNVYPELEKSLPAYPLKTPRILFRNLGKGHFEEMIEQGGAALGAPHCSRGCAFATSITTETSTSLT